PGLDGGSGEGPQALLSTVGGEVGGKGRKLGEREQKARREIPLASWTRALARQRLDETTKRPSQGGRGKQVKPERPGSATTLAERGGGNASREMRIRTNPRGDPPPRCLHLPPGPPGPW